MPIPTDFDYEINDIDTAARGITVLLTTMRRAKPADLDRMRKLLKDRVQAYADAVMQMAANEEGQLEVKRTQIIR